MDNLSIGLKVRGEGRGAIARITTDNVIIITKTPIKARMIVETDFITSTASTFLLAGKHVEHGLLRFWLHWMSITVKPRLYFVTLFD